MSLTSKTGGALPSDIASQAEAEAGSNNTNLMTPLRTAEAIAALAGGASISLPLRAWVESTGDDGTGTVGDPGKPYLTMLAAYNAGARMMHLGAGTFAGITKTGTIDLSYIGQGLDKTTITTITSTTGGAVSLRDVGFKSATIATISTVYTGVEGQAGGALALYGVRAGTVTAAGTVGRNGDDTIDMNGGDGGAGGNLTGSEIEITGDLTTSGGAGGAPYDAAGPSANAGNGASGGSVLVVGSLRVGGNASLGGGGAYTGLYGGTDGSPGAGGGVTVDELYVGNTLGMASGGELAYPGSLLAYRAFITAADFGGSSTNFAAISGTLIVIPTASGSPTTGDLKLSHINGVAIGTT